ncbi:hypothetical protein K469DRAFT_755457 [Zopfia rhizophila CBS 207.26]|uniref:Uncharacterized protein n=1 Tax=Zopfia rhizophila CBS 207.26 TaxID=1314779 RepID=A0A6A6DCY5_9PEZI|nr:hypothetical protein K469DRAFT_755457 [Zopfia rhizophila CBS 207.26]
MPPRHQPPTGFTWPTKRTDNPSYNHISQGYGIDYISINSTAVGTDGTGPCIGLYVRTNASACYVAHIDNSTILKSSDVPAVKSATEAKMADLGLESANEWFTIGGQADPYFVQGVMSALEEKFVKAGMLTRSQGQNYDGFIVDFGEDGGDEKLLFRGNGTGYYGWNAEKTEGDRWTLKKDGDELTF